MKFRGKMVDVSSISQFSKILATVTKLAKYAALRFTPTHVYFILSEWCSSGKSQVWCEMPQKNFFVDYQLSGYSEELNEIYLDLTVDYLTTAFRSALASKSVKIKLSKKHCACLSMEIEVPSSFHSSRSCAVLHDVPVTVIPRKYVHEFREPTLSRIDVSVCMPSLKVVRNVVDRMKNISTFLIISASSDGRLALKVETDTVAISTHFENLAVNTGKESRDGDMVEAEVRVDIRRVSQFLYGQAIHPDEVICNIAHNCSVQFFLMHSDVTLQFILPNISA